MAARTQHASDEQYSPLYFLAALGAGGLAANFYVWLLFWVPHQDRPVPVFEDIIAAVTNGATPLQGAIAVAVAGIVIFALLHLGLLGWNLVRFARYRRTEAARLLRTGNSETQLLALPLTVAMTINYTIGPGESCVVTTACLVSATRYQARGIADGDVEVLVLPSQVFHGLIAQSEGFRAMAFGVFASKVNAFVDVIDELLLRQGRRSNETASSVALSSRVHHAAAAADG